MTDPCPHCDGKATLNSAIAPATTMYEQVLKLIVLTCLTSLFAVFTLCLAYATIRYTFLQP